MRPPAPTPSRTREKTWILLRALAQATFLDTIYWFSKGTVKSKRKVNGPYRLCGCMTSLVCFGESQGILSWTAKIDVFNTCFQVSSGYCKTVKNLDYPNAKSADSDLDLHFWGVYPQFCEKLTENAMPFDELKATIKVINADKWLT